MICAPLKDHWLLPSFYIINPAAILRPRKLSIYYSNTLIEHFNKSPYFPQEKFT